MNASAMIAEALRLVPFVALVSLRVAVMLAMLPAPFGELAPARIRAALSFVIAFCLTLPTLGSAHDVPLEPGPLLVSSLAELMVGAVIGLTARVTLAAAEAAGTIAGNAMGLGFANTVDPLFGDEGMPTTTLMGSLSVLIFFVLQGHHVLLQALSASLTLAPCGRGFPPFHADRMVVLGARIMAQGLRIAAPVVATMFVVQLGMALASRAAPRVQVFALSFGMAVSVGALLLVACAPQIAQALADLITGIPDLLAQLLPGSAR
jgi:flagellar biosynthetic protein FliR